MDCDQAHDIGVMIFQRKWENLVTSRLDKMLTEGRKAPDMGMPTQAGNNLLSCQK